MSWELGVVADEITRDFAEAVRMGKRLGLHRYEVRNLPSGRIPLCDPSDIQAVDDVIAREGIEVTAISPGLFKYTEDAAAFEREMREIYPKAAELAHHWGLAGMIVFGFHKKDGGSPPQIAEWLSMAAARAAADALQLLIEPEPICSVDTCRAAVDLITRAGVSNVRINYDPGNVAWLHNRDPLDEFDLAAPWIGNVHIKDLRPLTRGPEHPEWEAAGEGMIDYRAHFRGLKAAGYDGPISLEPHMDGSEGTIRRCKQAVENLW